MNLISCRDITNRGESSSLRYALRRVDSLEMLRLHYDQNRGNSMNATELRNAEKREYESKLLQIDRSRLSFKITLYMITIQKCDDIWSSPLQRHEKKFQTGMV